VLPSVRVVVLIALLCLAACQRPSDRPQLGFKPSTPVVVIAAAGTPGGPTPAPAATATPPPPTARPTQEPDALLVVNTGALGLSVRPAPGSPDRLTSVTDGTRLAPTGEEQQAGTRIWRKVRVPDGREGWVAAEFTRAAPAEGPALPP
jgi:hypothetical protein